jgi:hypothetical protein
MAFLTIPGQVREARAWAGPRGHESAGSRRDLTGRSDRECPPVDGLMFAPRSHSLSALLTTISHQWTRSANSEADCSGSPRPSALAAVQKLS